MPVTLEISLYPLVDAHRGIISDFIRRLNALGIRSVTNGMSTQVFGEYDQVMAALTEALRPSMEAEVTVSVMIKAVNRHLPPDRWDPTEWS